MVTEDELRAQLDEVKRQRASLPPGEERSALNNEMGRISGEVWKLRRTPQQAKT